MHPFFPPATAGETGDRDENSVMNFELIEPFIEHQGERRTFWLGRPRAIGEKVLVARKGMRIPDSLKGRAVITLDFKTAFGTGGHGTTEGCLLALEKFIRGGESLLDAGTGTGILAIAARKLGAGRVTAVDIDSRACAETRKNLGLNGIDCGIDVIEGSVETVEGRFDVIAANLRTPALVEAMDALTEKLGDRGIAVFSGILEREVCSFLLFLERYPLDVLELRRIHGWITVAAEKRSTTGGSNQ